MYHLSDKAHTASHMISYNFFVLQRKNIHDLYFVK